MRHSNVGAYSYILMPACFLYQVNPSEHTRQTVRSLLFALFTHYYYTSPDMVDDDSASFGRHRNVFENLGDDEPSTFLEAQAVIENIRADKGHLDATTMRDVNEMPARSRQKIMYNMEKIRDMEAAFTKRYLLTFSIITSRSLTMCSISEQLYSSKYRFLYELIQNADDSLYRNARQKCVAPYLRFRITPHEFIVETNEDGFTRANVEAICATGKSSKKTSALDNHIGEKGFGFKVCLLCR